MKITTSGIPNPSLKATQPATAQPADVGAPINVAPSKDTYTPSPEFARLLNLVREQPQIREDRVREVADRLARGEYLTRDAAEKTAQAILEDSRGEVAD